MSSPEPTAPRESPPPIFRLRPADVMPAQEDSLSTGPGWLRRIVTTVIAIVFMTGLGLLLVDSAITLLTQFP